MRKNSRRLDLRERIIFKLLSTRPLRISELANLTVEDIDLSAKTFTIFRSKNHKTRVISPPRETWKGLEELIGENAPRERSLFGIGLRMMEWTAAEIIKKLRVAPNGRGSHAFRHTGIMGMLRDARIDPAVVAKITGNTPKTIYANYSSQVSVDEQRQAERLFDGRERGSFQGRKGSPRIRA